MHHNTVHTRILVISANAVFLRWSSNTIVSRFVRDALTTRLTSCKSTPHDWDVLVTDVIRGTKYDLEGLIESLSNDEDDQPQLDALHPEIVPYE